MRLPSEMALRVLYSVVLAGAACGLAETENSASPHGSVNQPIDRPFSLRLGEPFVLERQIGADMQSGHALGFTMPQPCGVSALPCAQGKGLAFSDSSKSAMLELSPIAGYEWRTNHENSHAMEMGLLAQGYRGGLSFRLDARMTTEMHEDFKHASYDREFIEKQDEAASGSVAYTSYSRYRGELNYDAAIGRISAGHDTPHWGPALYGNLVFHRDAIPFHYLSYQTGIGPLRVMTLYGQLQTEDDRVSGKKAQSRSVYAHRYEWAFGANWLVGISEQMIVYSYEEPFAFLPILPLFIYKGGAYERLNNGNIAGDANWRFAPWGRLYGEFLIDDIQSPSSLFDDNWGNKWAAVGGMQMTVSRVLPGMTQATRLGAIAEVARIEPWVYTHYLPGTAQSLNRGYPLGNSVGPDAWIFDLGLFADQKPWVLGMRLRLGEKGGTDAADLAGSPPRNTTLKHFLSGPVQKLWRMTAQGSYAFGSLHLQGDFGYEKNPGGGSPVGWVGVRWL